MVTQSHPELYVPQYDLDVVRQLGASKKVVLLNPRTTLRQMDTYQYYIEDLYGCLADLTGDEFKKSIYYDQYSAYCDVYKVKWVHETLGHDDVLYVKFYLRSPPDNVLILSFHPDGVL